MGGPASWRINRMCSADMSHLAKALASGLPMAAFLAHRMWVRLSSPETMAPRWGNPVAGGGRLWPDHVFFEEGCWKMRSGRNYLQQG